MGSGGLNFFPIAIGGSVITLKSKAVGEDAGRHTITKRLPSDAQLRSHGASFGWPKFVAVADLQSESKGFVTEDALELAATIRVRRLDRVTLKPYVRPDFSTGEGRR